MADRRHKKTKIRESLMKQLKEKGVNLDHYIDLVEDYMAFWDVKRMLQQDIIDRGVYVIYENGGGQGGTKKNDSISELRTVNSQMLKLLKELGLRGADIELGTSEGMGAEADDDEEM